MRESEEIMPPVVLEPSALPAPAAAVSMHAALRTVPLRLSVNVPLSGVCLRDIRELEEGQLFMSTLFASDDVPVRVGGALFAFAELDNVDGQMAVRLTRLS